MWVSSLNYNIYIVTFIIYKLIINMNKYTYRFIS